MSGRAVHPRTAARWRVAGAAAAACCLAASLAGHSRVSTRLTWHADVKPILERHCLGCHRTASDGRVSLETYRDARPWVRAIREEVLERRMPPWQARPGAGRFANERRLSPVEIDLLVAWADGGAPEGTSAPTTDEAASADLLAAATAGHVNPIASGPITSRPESGSVFPWGSTRANANARWSALIPHCPSPTGSFSLSIDPRSGESVALLEIADVAKPTARDPYRFTDPVVIGKGTRILVGGSAGCSVIATTELEGLGPSQREPARAPEDRRGSTGRAIEPATTSLGYWCPMHPEVQAEQPGTCERCAMALVNVRADLGRRYEWVVEARSGARAGRTTSLSLEVRERGSMTPVERFERLHEQDLHLFIVSEDHRQFDHVHPGRGLNGRFTLPWTPSQGGRYKLFGDFFPHGGAPQMLQHLLVVGGQGGRVPAASASSVTSEHTRSGVRARFEHGPAVSGETTRLTVALDDSKTGAAVQDLQPYLGSAGHLFAAPTDLDEGLHGHPEATGQSDPAHQTFEVRFPRAGRWNVWVQVKRRNAVLTFPFAVVVGPKA